MAIPYAVRVVVEGVAETEKDRLRAWFARVSPGHLVVEHGSDDDDQKVHWHALIYSDRKEQSFRNDFRREFKEITGNESYSFVEVKPKKRGNWGPGTPVEQYERYICHGEYEGSIVKVIMSCGLKYTPEWFVQQNKEFYELRKKYVKEKQQARDQGSMFDKLLAVCKGNHISEIDAIADKYIHMIKQEKRPMDIYGGKKIVWGVWLQLGGVEATAEVRRRLTS